MTEIKSDFRKKLEAIKEEYEAERKGLNIFRALHKEHDEKYLHSRFISYLLSPTSTHGMGNKFLEAFIDIISVKNPNFRKFKIDNCTIHPNENKKEEIEYIDILIENDNQAIVIENKIFAKASYHKGNIHQIDTYCKKMKEGIKNEEGKEIMKCKEDVFAIYLAPHKRDIEKEGVRYERVIAIEYQKEILEWIEKCIAITDNGFLTEVLYQYKSVMHSFTSNLDRVNNIKELLDNKDNIDEAWKIKDYILEKEKKDDGKETNQIKWGDFKHVQWHTIADFWDELAIKLVEEPINAKITNRITIEEISGIVHKNKKDSYGITFELGDGQEWYIVNDKINGLTYGINKKDKKDDDWVYINKNIKFTDFSNEDTFMLINAKKR